MEGEGAKTKTLAVFENVVANETRKTKRKFKTNQFLEDDSSPSESELVIDDDDIKERPKRKRNGIRIQLKQEILNMKCEWDNCFQVFSDLDLFAKHISSHGNLVSDLDCKWNECPQPYHISSNETLIRHISYHGYLTKLVNIGANVVNRNSFPECSLPKNYTINIPRDCYVCEWKNCDITFNTIFQFLNHVKCHVNAAPTGKKVLVVEVIECLWSGCVGKYATRYKLEEHLRVHTKEKVIACPTCRAMFSCKTKFGDHRKCQLDSDMKSYQCSQCLKLFAGERLLSDHMRSHINQYKCTMCDMTSPKPSMLAKHYRYRHMDVRPFTCNLCPKTFVTKSNLNQHLLTHQEKPFKCDQCEFGCKSKVGLRNHMSRVHGLEEFTYECQVCKEKYKRGDYLTSHLINIHNFHWPSGHCRFRYRKDLDGIHRLQTVRYESLEVTEQVIKSESMQSTKNSSAVTYNVTYDKDAADGYQLTVVPDTESSIFPDMTSENSTRTSDDKHQVVIIIEDVDETGKVIHRREMQADEITFATVESVKHEGGKEIASNKDMPVFEMICFKEEN